MDFSDALRCCKDGSKIARDDWNAPGQFVFRQEAYPKGVLINKNTAKATGLPENTIVKVDPYFTLFNAQGTLVPWVPSQGDLNSEKWSLVH